MQPVVRKVIPYVLLALLVGAMGWAVSFGTLPPADFTFNNGDELRTLDPAKATGAPEGRIINALFEGLLRNLPADSEPDEQGLVPLEPVPAVAESYTVSEDGRVYRFRIRPTARWSDDTPLTADDFVWSWRRFLHPETGAEYAYQLYYVRGAESYNKSLVEVGEKVEVELTDRPDPNQPFPRGTMVHGILREIVKPSEPADGRAGVQGDPQQGESPQSDWIYVVEVKGQDGQAIDWDAPGPLRGFSRQPPAGGVPGADGAELAGPIETCHQVLLDFQAGVGIRAPDARTLVVTLNHRTPFFDELVAFYPLYPVNRRCVETHGVPNWTKPENMVGNGPFLLEFRRIRDRIRMVKNLRYWNASEVALEIIDAMAINSETTSLNMYLQGQLDWASTVPNAVIPDLRQRPDYRSAPMLTTYFYRLNVTRPPLDNVRVRQALNLAINKQQICDHVTRAGQQPARSFVPPGLKGYRSPQAGQFDVAEARRLLAEAGYPQGRDFPRIQILYNTSDAHRAIAEVIQQQWKRHLGIDVELRNLEWGTFLDTLQNMDYVVARSGWIGDYPDPNTFLDMFVSGGANNQTGWSHPQYDRLIRQAESQPDPERRLRMLQQAEAILMEELPIVPLYFYVSINLVNPRVEGFFPNIQDLHPLHILRMAEPPDDEPPAAPGRTPVGALP